MAYYGTKPLILLHQTTFDRLNVISQRTEDRTHLALIRIRLYSIIQEHYVNYFFSPVLPQVLVLGFEGEPAVLFEYKADFL